MVCIGSHHEVHSFTSALSASSFHDMGVWLIIRTKLVSIIMGQMSFMGERERSVKSFCEIMDSDQSSSSNQQVSNATEKKRNAPDPLSNRVHSTKGVLFFALTQAV